MSTYQEIRRAVERAIERSHSAADPAWVRDFTFAIHVACLENHAIIIDDVWAVFERLGFESRTQNRMAAGALMRHAACAGWMTRCETQDPWTPSRRNHNWTGLTQWRSLIYDAGFDATDLRRAGQQELDLGA